MCKSSLLPYLSQQSCSSPHSCSTAQVTQTSSPHLSWAPCHLATPLTAASLAPAVPTGLQLQPYKGGQAGHRAGREPCWTLHSSIAMGSSAFTLVLVLALVTCVTPAERKVWGQLVVGMWQTSHWKAAWAARGWSLLNVILSWDKQESFASTFSRQWGRYL